MLADVIIAVTSFVSLLIGVAIGYFYWLPSRPAIPQKQALMPPPSEEISQAVLASFTPPSYKFKSSTGTKRKSSQVINAAARKAIVAKFTEVGSINAVAETLGHSWVTVAKVLKLAGVETPIQRRAKISPEIRKAVQEALASGERSVRSVAREFDISPTAVHRISKESL